MLENHISSLDARSKHNPVSRSLPPPQPILFINDVLPIPQVVVVAIGAQATIQSVVSRAADKLIVSPTAVEDIVSGFAEKNIVPFLATEHIVTQPAVQNICIFFSPHSNRISRIRSQKILYRHLRKPIKLETECLQISSNRCYLLATHIQRKRAGSAIEGDNRKGFRHNVLPKADHVIALLIVDVILASN